MYKILAPVLKCNGVLFCFCDWNKLYYSYDELIADNTLSRIFGELGLPELFTWEIPYIELQIADRLYVSDGHELTYGRFLDRESGIHKIMYLDLNEESRNAVKFGIVDCKHENIVPFIYNENGIQYTDNVCTDCTLTLSEERKVMLDYAITTGDE